MTFFRPIAFGALLLLSVRPSIAHSAEYFIVENGKPKAVIIISETDVGKAPLKVLFLGNSQLRTHAVAGLLSSGSRQSSDSLIA